TRHGFLSFGNWHSLNLLACGGGGGGTSTFTGAVAVAVRLRESVQVALIVIGPAAAPLVFKVPVLPSPEILPPVAVQLPTGTGTLSGLLQVQVMVAVVPA